ncbi:MAG TPA: RDD family protein [Mycobacteriales bacterium]|nr:RDD family protein [Mycobacteriales bacterium]
MASRWTGSWLGGPRAARIDLGYPGERLGLPASGRGSVAGFGRRLAAYAVDSVLSNLVALAVFGQRTAWGIFVVFAVEVFVLTALGGATAGMQATRLRIARLDGRPPGWIAAAVRTVLLLLLVPALIWDRDRRGLHDRAAGTVVVRV